MFDKLKETWNGTSTPVRVAVVFIVAVIVLSLV